MIAERMDRRSAQRHAWTSTRAATQPEEVETDDETRRRLRALGYVG